MTSLYITSVEDAGKTALCAGIGKKLQGRGIKVGFMVPFVTSSGDAADGGLEDAAFMQEILGLKESTKLLCPFALSRSELWQGLTEGAPGLLQRLKQVYRKIARSKDIVIMEGLGNLDRDKISALACYTVADFLEAKVIIALCYSPGLEPQKILQIGNRLGERLLGVVVNLVPQSRMEMVRRDLAISFERAGIKVLGLLPDVRSLLGITVAELARSLDGEILTSLENTKELIENIMLGAMTPDSGVDYFSRKSNKAVIVRGDRADMQLAALQTVTKCLVLTGNISPLPVVIARAKERNVPIIVTGLDAAAAIASIEAAWARAHFRHVGKLEKFRELLDCHFDFKILYSELGLED
ncbi:MAG TPA: phosphotransacetylase family protein [Dehalococcoidia bacterium]|nr:phosphotransacetylase family protein [Dehalococcoidia bacterium]